MDRRNFLKSAAIGLGTLSQPIGAFGQGAMLSKMGIADFSIATRIRAERDGVIPRRLTSALAYLEYCRSIGSGGVQCEVGLPDPAAAAATRDYAERHNMFIVASNKLPHDSSGLERFELEVRAAKAVGADVMRVPFGDRRYEQFDAFGQFEQFRDRVLKSLQLCEPILAEHKVAVAIENHKDFRVEQMLHLVQSLDSEYVGICVDTGNSAALLEDCLEVAKAYAPWALSVHLKDFALAEYKDGLLLADVTLGEGLLDLPGIVDTLQAARPNTLITLEMSTRDALKIPCLTDKYWRVMADASAVDLARMIALARTHPTTEGALPKVNHLSPVDRIAIEDENIRKCQEYATKHLNL